MFKTPSLVSGLAVLLLCSTAQSALAATALLAPSGEWTVGPIAAQGSEGQKFCSMKNNYPANQSVVFAVDNMGANSIAVDFHRDIFEVGNQYDVKAHSGSVTRHVDGLASSAQVLVMQTGIDTELYGQFARKHNVTFTVDKKNYSFELDVSAADGLAALEHCSESLQSNAGFTPAKFPLGKVHPESLKQLAASEVDAIPVDGPLPSKKKKHKHKSGADDAVELDQELAKEQLQVKVVDREPPSPAQVDTVRDDMKTEIASELLNIHNGPQKPDYDSPSSAAAVSAMDKADSASDHAAGTLPENTELKSLLLSAHVITDDQPVTASNNGNAIRWTSKGLFGSAQQLPLAPGKDLVDTANEYLHKTSVLCKGDFAQKAGHPQTAGATHFLEADITCLDGKNNAAAAVLFVARQHTFSVISEEGTIDQLHDAMLGRDAILSAVKDSAPDSPADNSPAKAPAPIHSITRGPDLLQNTVAPAMSADPMSETPDTGMPVPVVAEDDALPPVHLIPPPAVHTTADAPPPVVRQSDASPDIAQTPAPTAPEQNRLMTQPGLQIGAGISKYKYREQTSDVSPFMNESGAKFSALANYTVTLPPAWYLRGEGRYAIGPTDYSSASGTQAGQENNLWEVRGLVGYDFSYGNYVLSPYGGLGFRYLYNDMRGLTSLGGGGYRRISYYHYAPVGLTDRYRLTDKSDISFNLEYDIFTSGEQRSYISDAIPAFGNILNHQNAGKGVRGDILFEVGGWSIGPWFNYWGIRASDLVPIPGDPGFGGQEPTNKTTEIGLKIMKQVW